MVALVSEINYLTGSQKITVFSQHAKCTRMPC